jgi:hypothetical protein
MKQYTYSIVHKTQDRANTVRATAKTPEIARAQIVLMYGRHHTVAELFCDIDPPHRILGEIDCSDFPDTDMTWLMNEAAQIEGVTA